MKKFAKVMAVAAACAAVTCSVAAFAGCSGDADITVSGSSSVTPLMEVLAAVYEAQTGLTVSINQSDSGTGISEAKAGSVDIGMASRDLKDGETADNVDQKTIAVDGIALIVNKNCAQESVTLAEVTALYSEGTAIDGNITSAISREDGSGTRDAFDDKFGITELSSTVTEQSSTGAVIQAISNDSSYKMMGYISLGSLESAVEQGCKALKIELEDGTVVEPSVENVKNNSYTLWRNFNLVYRTDTLSDAAKDFIDWIMDVVGQAVIMYEGYIPVSYDFTAGDYRPGVGSESTENA